MRIIRTPEQLQQIVGRLHRTGRTIGFVPTMGALHEGHLSLIRLARRQTDRVVVSIFINPIQFTQRRDFTRYPRPTRRDTQLARRAGVDLLFRPRAADLYPPNFQTTVDVSRVSRRWEGAHRPGHFRGVATVVATLFNLAQPDVAYFGEKDAQQVRVVEQLVRDLHWPVRIVVGPTVREPGGLAMSSRNARLSPSERRRALVVFAALQAGRRLIECGESRRAVLLQRVAAVVRQAGGVRLGDAAPGDPAALGPVTHVEGPVRFVLAVWVGDVRLIDTMLVPGR